MPPGAKKKSSRGAASPRRCGPAAREPRGEPSCAGTSPVRGCGVPVGFLGGMRRMERSFPGLEKQQKRLQWSDVKCGCDEQEAEERCRN